MGCYSSDLSRQVERAHHQHQQKHVMEPELRIRVTQDEVRNLGVLAPDLTDEEFHRITSRGNKLRYLNEDLDRLPVRMCCRELPEKKPARITAVNLAGEAIAKIEISVNAKAQHLEKCICHSAGIDTRCHSISLTYGGKVIPKAQNLSEAGIQPEDDVVMNVIKSPKHSKTMDRELFQAAWNRGGHPDAIQALLNANADPDGFTYSDGDRALHVAAGRGNGETVRMLLEARADANVRGVYGMTPMERCSQQSTTYWKGRHPRVQELLRQHAAVLKATANQR